MGFAWNGVGIGCGPGAPDQVVFEPRHSRGQLTVVSIQTRLDEILSFRLGDKRLELSGRESVDQSGLRHDEEQYLNSGQGRKLISLIKSAQGGVNLHIEPKR